MFRNIKTHTALTIAISFGLFISISSGYALYKMEENKIVHEFRAEINNHKDSLHKEIIINLEGRDIIYNLH